MRLARVVLALVLATSVPLQWMHAQVTNVLLAHHDVQQAIAFVNVTVIPMDVPGVHIGQTVLVRKGRIVAVGADRDVPLPHDVSRIDGRGMYLLPGLVDAHVHLLDERATPDFAMYLANGVTTIRNMQGAPLHLRLRDEIARGARLGPTLYTTSAFVDIDVVHSLREARQFVQRASADGYDAIKLHSPLPPDLFKAVAEEALRRDPYRRTCAEPTGLARRSRRRRPAHH